MEMGKEELGNEEIVSNIITARITIDQSNYVPIFYRSRFTGLRQVIMYTLWKIE